MPRPSVDEEPKTGAERQARYRAAHRCAVMNGTLQHDHAIAEGRAIPTGREDDPTGGRSPVMPAKADIHDCAARSKESHGYRPSPIGAKNLRGGFLF
jgi:hypothetical protein